MDGIERLAIMLADMYKANRNPPSTSIRVATVVETDPLKIQWGENVLLTDDKIILPKLYTTGHAIPNRWQDLNGNMVEDTLIWKVPLEPGDQILIAPDESLKSWFLIDKL